MSQWQEVSAEEYYYSLGCVPPAKQDGSFFAVGEVSKYDRNGKAIHAVYGIVNVSVREQATERFFVKLDALENFNREKYLEELNEQGERQ